MKNKSKKLIFSIGLMVTLAFSPIASELIACCVGNYSLCESWKGDVIEDV